MTSNFAQAQQRLAARQQAREAENTARLAAQRADTSTSRAARTRAQLDRLPFPFARLNTAWDAVSSREGISWGLNAATALVGLGLYEFETNDVGITEALKRVWTA
ncbi:hypothetical protein BN1723_002093, partial [Verticillium longisporum]